MYKIMLLGQVWCFDSLKMLMVKVLLVCFGDVFVGVIVILVEEWMVVKMVFVEVLLIDIFDNLFIFYE